jgi:hypothetical protein
MSDEKKLEVGTIGWVDLTVADAPEVRDFYRAVVGWTTSEVDMGGYSDYCMNLPESGRTVAGVCHARGENADLPPRWLVYVNVADLDRSLMICTERGGKILSKVRSAGPNGRFCVIEDPAGAVAALFEPPRTLEEG